MLRFVKVCGCKSKFLKLITRECEAICVNSGADGAEAD
jgi:hypothetical protein